MSKGFAGALLAILAIVVLAVLLWPSGGDAAENQWLASVAAFRHSQDAYTTRQQAKDRRIARLETVAAALNDSVNTLTDAVDSLDSLSGALAAKGDTGAALAVLRQASKGCSLALAVCKQRGDSLQAAVDTAVAAKDSAERRVEHADSLLAVGQKVTDCRVLLLRCPTRVQAFEAGTGVGALLLALLAVFLHR
jgi:hypothetical protein